MAKPLLDRIAADLKPTGRLADCRRDLAEAQKERATVEVEIADAERRAEDPSVADDEARLAGQQASDWRFHARRLDRGIAELKDAIAAKEADESYAQRRDEFAAAKAARDALVERWHALRPLWDLLPALLAETAENDRLIAQANSHKPKDDDRLQSAEVVARGALNDQYWPNSIGQNGEPFARLATLRLPFFDKPGSMDGQTGTQIVVNEMVKSVGAGLRAAAAARKPEAIAAAKKAEAARWTRYEITQKPYRGSVIMDVAHREGFAVIGHTSAVLWMHEGQADAARKLGLTLKPAPLKAPLEEVA